MGHRPDCDVFYYAGDCSCGFIKPWPAWAFVALLALVLAVLTVLVVLLAVR